MTSDLRDMPPITANANAKGIELSAYDEQRQPHTPIWDESEVVAAPRSLQAELCCPICLDLLTNTMTTKECLHRFCAECIQMAMMRGNKECPTCRKKLVSRRSLRPDPNFDTLIAKIYPSRDAYNDAQNQALEIFHKSVNTEALQCSIQAGIKAQAKARKQRVQGSYDYEKRRRKPKIADETPSTEVSASSDPAASGQPSQSHSPSQHAHDSDSCSSAPTGATSTTAPADEANWLSNEVEIILQPTEAILLNPNISNAIKQTRYLKTTQSATIAHISTYLKMRIDQDTNDAKSFLLKTQNPIDKTEDVSTPADYLLYAEMTHQPTINLKNALPKNMPLQTHIQSVLAGNGKNRRTHAPLTLIFNIGERKD